VNKKRINQKRAEDSNDALCVNQILSRAPLEVAMLEINQIQGFT